MKLLFESLSTMLFEADLLFECFQDKIKISGMTPLEKSLVYAELDTTKFDVYYLKHEYQFSIYHKSAFQALKSMGATNELVIAFIDSETNADLYNNIIFRELHPSGDVDTNLIRRLEVDAISPIPVLHFDTFVRCESARFNSIIKTMKTFKCVDVLITVTPSVIEFQCRQEDSGRVRSCQIKRALPDDVVETFEVSGTFPVDILANIAKASALAKNMKIHVGPNMPLCIEMDVATYGRVWYCASET